MILRKTKSKSEPKGTRKESEQMWQTVETLKRRLFSKASNCLKNKIQKTNCIQKSINIKK
jgi:hypothetical protein